MTARISLSKVTLAAAIFVASQSARAFDTSVPDELFAKRAEGAAAIQAARNAYSTLVSKVSGSELVDVIEKLSRLDHYEASVLEQQSGNSAKQIVIYQRCLDNLDKIGPAAVGETAQYYYWKATCLGGWANANGILSSLFKVNELFGYINKGATVDASYEGGGFDRIAGRVYNKLPSVNLFGPRRDLNLSKSLLEKSIASPGYTHSTHPDLDRGANHYNVYEYLKDTLVDLGQVESAKKILDDAIENYNSGHVDPDQLPETELEIARLKAQRAKL